MVNALLIPPKMLIRALDDLHLIAVAAHGLNDRLAGIEKRADRIEGQIDTAIDTAASIERRGEEAIASIAKILALGKRVDSRAESLLSVIERLDARAAQILAFGEQIDDRAAALLTLGERAEERAGEVMEQARAVSDVAAQVAASGAEVAMALPLLQRAIELTEPLEGTVERLGRIVDRLPKGRPRPAAGSKTKTKP